MLLLSANYSGPCQLLLSATVRSDRTTVIIDLQVRPAGVEPAWNRLPFRPLIRRRGYGRK
jgi:hypothetical protein